MEKLSKRLHEATSSDTCDSKSLESTLSILGDLAVFPEFPLELISKSSVVADLLRLATPQYLDTQAEVAIK